MIMAGKYTFGKFLKFLIFASIAAAVLSYYPVSVYAGKIQIYSFILGYIISLLNALLGYKLSLMAFNKSVKSFMILVFGGMGIRLLIVIIFLLILIQFTSVDSISLAGSVFFFYTLFVSIEIFFLHKISGGSGSKKKETEV
jgi:hypothetical protein